MKHFSYMACEYLPEKCKWYSVEEETHFWRNSKGLFFYLILIKKEKYQSTTTGFLNTHTNSIPTNSQDFQTRQVLIQKQFIVTLFDM